MSLISGWSTDTLENLALSIDYGHTASATLNDTGIKFLRITDIQDGKVDWKTVPFCDATKKEVGRYELASGDIVFARTGATTGKSFLIEKCPSETVFASYLIRVRPDRRLNSRYLFHYFQTSDYWRQVFSRSTGTAQAGVNASKLAGLRIPVPPLEEQRRIAEVLDKADALRQKRRLALQKLDTLLQSVFLEMFGDQDRSSFLRVNNTSSGGKLAWKKLTDVAQLATGHTPSRKVTEYWNGTIPWITLTDIRRLDGRVAFETTEHTNELGIKKSSAVRLPARTVCLSRTASVGFVTMMGKPMATSQDFVNWVCGPELNPTYLMWALIFSRPSIKSLSSGTTHKTIYFSTVEEFRVFCAPIDQQNNFEKVAEHVSTLKTKLEETVAHADDLFKSLQNQAFKGELFKSSMPSVGFEHENASHQTLKA